MSGSQTVVCLGDSITKGRLGADWVTRLRTRPTLANFEFVNAGVDGDLAWNALQRLDAVVQHAPSVVTILLGTNDVAATFSTRAARRYCRYKRLPRTPSAEWYCENINAILGSLRERTDARVALLQIPMLGEDLASDINHRVRAYNASLGELALQHEAALLPLYDRLAPLLPPPHHRAPYDGRVLSGITAGIAHQVLGRSWDDVAARRGLALFIDHVHLNDRSGAELAALVEDHLSKVDPPANGHDT